MTTKPVKPGDELGTRVMRVKRVSFLATRKTVSDIYIETAENDP
jgi:hypothetical protein